jgi:cyclohexadienyl dehydratase
MGEVRRGRMALLCWAAMVAAAPAPPPSRFARIQHAKLLRVGTTGDYAPYSVFDAATGEYHGIDIELARSLGRALGVKIEFVPTSWPSLLEDSVADRFDVAMSGITRTVERARVVAFSAPYHHGGKTPLARCKDRDRYGSLAAIDQPGVTVVVNPGGTNQSFVRARVRRARILVAKDNPSCFAMLLASEADVMITEAIEAAAESRLHPALCATMPGTTFTKTDIAVLVQRDAALERAVDAWLAEETRSGRVRGLFAPYGEGAR